MRHVLNFDQKYHQSFIADDNFLDIFPSVRQREAADRPPQRGMDGAVGRLVFYSRQTAGEYTISKCGETV